MSPRRTYDHRIREAIVASGDPNLFPELNIPPSTTRTWLKEGSQLDGIATVRRLVGFYVREHNEIMPHWAFKGFTPDEVYFGKTEGVVESLQADD